MSATKSNQKDARLFSSKRFAILGLFATIFASMLAYYYFLESQKTRRLTYYIHPAKAVVIDSARSTNLEIFFKGKEIKSSITTVQIAIWNRGDLSIKMEDILQDVIIKTKNGTQILEATIRTTTRDVINLQLDSEEIQSGRLGVHWKILEESDGGVIQVTYVGTPQTIIEFEGIIEGQGQIEELKYQGKIQDAMEQYKFQISFTRFFGYTLITLFVSYSFFYILWIKFRRKFKPNLRKESKFISYASLGIKYGLPLMILTLFALSYYFLIYKQPPNPPFGF